ncbi:uncharacterized protein GGS25DRAFT_495930 [Hypoxylon fragiforme]|uniref:uncharacterized protein n=1 Tax=Hypoxylon fragiforme TaxID=63214 RepID=UPI0020C6E62C|nr:uncharacterized protein GGS25DRAFT_495930 [Hypoxylon fragiforme]KAI2607454.1 hypothetical protein GGS25DRAFT_495930 [Hypoxylon fragiforme]
MKLSSTVVSLWLALVLGQQFPECTRELAATDDCADVINANACYNQFRFRNNQTLSCIGGTTNDERALKACKCCSCVGTQMCNWVTQSRFQC